MSMLSEVLSQLPTPMRKGPHAWRMMTPEECKERECEEGARLTLPDAGMMEVLCDGPARRPLYAVLWFSSARADEDCIYQGPRKDLAIVSCAELARDWDDAQDLPASY
jgi:hypothetical protein